MPSSKQFHKFEERVDFIIFSLPNDLNSEIVEDANHRNFVIFVN